MPLLAIMSLVARAFALVLAPRTIEALVAAVPAAVALLMALRRGCLAGSCLAGGRCLLRRSRLFGWRRGDFRGRRGGFRRRRHPASCRSPPGAPMPLARAALSVGPAGPPNFD